MAAVFREAFGSSVCMVIWVLKHWEPKTPSTRLDLWFGLLLGVGVGGTGLPARL